MKSESAPDVSVSHSDPPDAAFRTAHPALLASNPRRILIIKPSSLGDIVHALTIVADIRANRPELAIDWVAESGFVALLELHPGVRRIIPVAMRRWRHRAFDASTWREVGSFRDALQREEYAAVLDLQEQV